MVVHNLTMVGDFSTQDRGKPAVGKKQREANLAGSGGRIWQPGAGLRVLRVASQFDIRCHTLAREVLQAPLRLNVARIRPALM